MIQRSTAREHTNGFFGQLCLPRHRIICILKIILTIFFVADFLYLITVPIIIVKAVSGLSWIKSIVALFFGYFFGSILVAIPVFFIILLASPLMLLYSISSSFQDTLSTNQATVIIPTLLPSENVSTPNFLPEDFIISSKATISNSFGYSNGKSYSNPVEVVISFTGKAASEAIRYGHVEIMRAEYYTDGGGILENLSNTEDWKIIDHAEIDNFTEKLENPIDGFTVKLEFISDKKPSKIGLLKGNIQIQYIDHNNVINVLNLDSMLNQSTVRLDEPRMNSIGKFFIKTYDFSNSHNQYENNITNSDSIIEEGSFNYMAMPDLYNQDRSDTKNFTVIVKDSLFNDMLIRIVDFQGNIISTSWEFSVSNSRSFSFSIPAKKLIDSRLEIIPSFTTVKVPFELSNIQITK